MKTEVFRIDWLIPFLGIALLGVGYSLARSYLRFEQESRSSEQSMAICDRLREDCDLARMLVQAQNDGCTTTGRDLDELLAAGIVTVKAQTTSAEARTRRVAEACFDYLDRRRLANYPMGAGLPARHGTPQLAAQSVSPHTLATASPAK